MKLVCLTSILLSVCTILSGQIISVNNGREERAYLIKALTRIADPVLFHLSKEELKLKMPVEAQKDVTDRTQYTYLEAFGRLLAGMAPWLELGSDNTAEGKIRKKYIALARRCIENATDPASADFMNFKEGKQPLVDAAFLAQALLRAPNQLWNPLGEGTKKNVIDALKSSRIIKPYNNNWLLFSAMVETALLKLEGACDTSVIEYALRQHFGWYKGDGTYGDGEYLHWDYYNSFVIQPMMLEIVQVLIGAYSSRQTMYDTVLKRAVRYASVQERLISPEGTYPPIGRSLAYRFGAFQLLSKIAWMKALPKEIKPQQVRAALYTIVKRQIEAPGTFDNNGWLTIGFYGHQPNIGESYISTGSLYLCAQVFILLGLPANDELWQGKDIAWTSKRVWKGEEVQIDHAKD